jgi:hypothetical protein
MWGKRKIAILLRREGIKVSVSTVGRTLAHLVARGAIVAVPSLRRRPCARRIRFTRQTATDEVFTSRTLVLIVGAKGLKSKGQY